MSAFPDLPHFHVEGHRSEFVMSSIDGTDVVIAMGRSHLYEGWQPDAIGAVIRRLAAQGCTHVLLTNAAGGLHPFLQVGDIVLATDVWNTTGRRCNTTQAGRSPILTHAWREATHLLCIQRGIPVRQGTYVSVMGPSYETRAEIRMYRRMGADVIGMSTAIEAECAHAQGMKVMAASIVTNLLSDSAITHVDHHDVLDAGRQGASHMWSVVRAAAKAAIFTE